VEWSGEADENRGGNSGRRRSRPCSSLVDAVMLAFSHRDFLGRASLALVGLIELICMASVGLRRWGPENE